MTESVLRRILENAIWAPSGDNCQPWTFKWDGETLHVFHDAQRAHHPMNPQGIASMIALGCLLEAFDLAASEFGLKTVASLDGFKGSGASRWAQVKFIPSSEGKSPLTAELLKRSTDRRLFQGGNLASEMLQKTELFPARLHVLPKPSNELIEYIVESEQLLAQHPDILPATMSWARFTLKQAQETRDGLSWRNMGTKLWEVPMMPLIRDHQWIFQIARHTIAPQHRVRVTQQLRSSAGLICVSAPINHRANFVTSGRLMMNAWLSLTGHGYGVQPLTLASLVGVCAREGIMALPEKWIRFHRDGETLLREHFSIAPESTPVWMIRTGKSTPLPENARTFRRPLKDIFSL